MRISYFLLAAVLMLCTYQGHARDPIIQIVTEDWKPYSYLENGEAKGRATEIVKKVMDKAGLEYTIKVLPWARSYNIALRNPNTLIFAIVRTEEREPLFKWVGQVAPADQINFYKNASRKDITIETLKDAKNFRIGVNIESDKHQFLKKKGFDNLSLVSDQSLSIKQLMLGRIDLWIMHEINKKVLLEESEIPQADIISAFTAYQAVPYMAFSQNTSDDIVKRVIKAYNELKATNELEIY